MTKLLVPTNNIRSNIYLAYSAQFPLLPILILDNINNATCVAILNNIEMPYNTGDMLYYIKNNCIYSVLLDKIRDVCYFSENMSRLIYSNVNCHNLIEMRVCNNSLVLLRYENRIEILYREIDPIIIHSFSPIKFAEITMNNVLVLFTGDDLYLVTHKGIQRHIVLHNMNVLKLLTSKLILCYDGNNFIIHDFILNARMPTTLTGVKTDYYITPNNLDYYLVDNLIQVPKNIIDELNKLEKKDLMLTVDGQVIFLQLNKSYQYIINKGLYGNATIQVSGGITRM